MAVRLMTRDLDISVHVLMPPFIRQQHTVHPLKLAKNINYYTKFTKSYDSVQ